MDDLRLTIHQTAPNLGDLSGNEEDIRGRVAQSASRDLVVFPELALTGYSLRNRVQRLAFPLSDHSPLELPPDAPPVVVGLPERGEDELVYNSALLVHGHGILAKHRKVYLPTYGPFDEGRYFAPGQDAPPVATIPVGWKVGMLICEDFWHPALHYLLAVQKAEVVVVLSAAPGRGAPEEPAEAGALPERVHPTPALFSSPERWVLLARAAALQYGVFLVLANRAGTEEGVTFAGDSVVVSPNGNVLARAPQADPAVLDCSLPREELRQARTPYAHLRDEDPGFLWRALGRLQAQS
jgi:predicted amidohydrolase